MVTLHSDTLTEGREGRASEALDEITAKKEATNTRLLRMQDSICEACPKTSATKCEAKLGPRTADSAFRDTRLACSFNWPLVAREKTSHGKC
jgi:hypothetical protein